jgi:transcriptional regulator with XRE-family HTH domain
LIAWSQTDLAQHAGISRATVADFESGKRQPIGNNLAAIRSALENAGVEFIADTGVKARAVYLVVSVRIRRGLDVQEGRYYSEAEAVAHMDGLVDDPDCLLAEVQRWPVASIHNASPEKILLVAQAERIGSQWRRVDGEIRFRTNGGEAEAILKDNRRT